jgi:hypothetical protein
MQLKQQLSLARRSERYRYVTSDQGSLDAALRGYLR